MGCTVADKSASDAPAAQQKPKPPEKVSSPARSRHVLIDMPRLAFARMAEVNSVLGMPRQVKSNANVMAWSEGAVTSAFYSRAQCDFLAGHLVSITYKFKTKPKTAEDALEWSGLPREAADLDNNHPDHLPYLAFYAPNPQYRNPVRCCGLLLQWVSITEDRGEIQINFANINEHYADWPLEIRSSWLRSGASPL